MNRANRTGALAVGLLLLGHSALAQTTPPDYGLTWKTVGAPGNSPTPPSQTNYPEGAVAYEYRLTQTEITRGQWFEFVKAYAPYALTQFHGLPNGLVGSGFLNLSAGYAQPSYPATMSFDFAARYCNWLQNDKANTAAAFAQGVYDTTTFTYNADHTPNHNLTHAADARYWVPSLDEWVKGAHYDPDKNGPNQPGYWNYSGKSDVPLISGPPESGGQTNAGPIGGPHGVGSYPDVQSPWGLLDTSGGVMELLSTFSLAPPHYPVKVGSTWSSQSEQLADYIQGAGLTLPNDATCGLRLASSVPAPGTTLIAACPIALFFRRSRKAT